jgi:YidC/Oxa1 family membrane protein insertase
MFTTIVIAPLYNALIFLVNHTPGQQLWIAMVILTVFFKILLIPLFKKQVRDQIVLTHLGPKIKQLQERFKNDRQMLAKETLALYSKYKVSPLMSILILIIQLPFLIGLYQIFYYDLSSHQNLLYTGINFPENISKIFFSFDLAQKSLILAVLAGISQYILGTLMFPNKKEENKANKNEKPDTQAEFMRAMNLQMKYFLPVMIAFISYITPAVIALYMIVTNIFSIVQEYIIKKPLEEKVKLELGE